MGMNELFVCKELYKYCNLLAAIDAYENIARISIHEMESYWKLCFSDCVYGTARTIHEFENYLIGLENC